jgi:hypothetical protein
MATAVTDPVARFHAANAKAAGARYGVDPADILAIMFVEGGTSASGAPVRPGDGAGPPSYGQFTFGTGRALGVQFGNSASETDAIARYLVQLGYKKDRRRAFGAYNGGPGNPQMGYADKVIAAAKRYAGIGGGPVTSTPTPSSSDTGSSGGGGGRGLAQRLIGGLPRLLLIVALFGGGLALAYVGLRDTTGARGG